MSDLTGRVWPPPPGISDPVRVAAMKRLLQELGMKETDGPNWGPFIRRMGGYFLSAERLATYAPGQKRAGKLYWCALTVCGMVYEELIARGHKELASQWRRIASAECSTLWANLSALGWAWLRPDALDEPAPGDFTFYGGRKSDGSPDFVHVDFYRAPLDGENFESVGGNTGFPVANLVDTVPHRGPEKLARVLGYARLPW